MIVDTLANASQYQSISPRLAAALDYLRQNKDALASMAPGKYEIQGTQLYALVQEYQSKDRSQGKWEAHRKYIDVQYVARGTEAMGCAALDEMKVKDAYNETKDVLFFEGEGQFLRAPAETFFVFFPQDVHMPGIALKSSEPIRKVVMKVAV